MRESDPLVRMPAGMTFENAAAASDGAILALMCLESVHPQKGQKILVYGASGSIGSAGVQLARHFGAQLLAGTCPDAFGDGLFVPDDRARNVPALSEEFVVAPGEQRAAAIVLNDLGSSAYYVGGIAGQAGGRASPWVGLGVLSLYATIALGAGALGLGRTPGPRLGSGLANNTRPTMSSRPAALSHSPKR